MRFSKEELVAELVMRLAKSFKLENLPPGLAGRVTRAALIDAIDRSAGSTANAQQDADERLAKIANLASRDEVETSNTELAVVDAAESLGAHRTRVALISRHISVDHRDRDACRKLAKFCRELAQFINNGPLINSPLRPSSEAQERDLAPLQMAPNASGLRAAYQRGVDGFHDAIAPTLEKLSEQLADASPQIRLDTLTELRDQTRSVVEGNPSELLSVATSITAANASLAAAEALRVAYKEVVALPWSQVVSQTGLECVDVIDPTSTVGETMNAGSAKQLESNVVTALHAETTRGNLDFA